MSWWYWLSRGQGSKTRDQGGLSETDTYSLLFIRNKIPTEAGVSDPRLAVLDLSGLTLRAGLRIKF